MQRSSTSGFGFGVSATIGRVVSACLVSACTVSGCARDKPAPEAPPARPATAEPAVRTKPAIRTKPAVGEKSEPPTSPQAPATHVPFKKDEALATLYGPLKKRGDARLWPLPDEVLEDWTMADAGPAKVDVLAVLPFREAGAERRYLVTKLVPLAEEPFDCHACLPGIGAALFTRAADGWRMDAGSPYITTLGAWGGAPEPSLRSLGAGPTALVFESSYCSGGTMETHETWLLPHDGRVREALTLRTGGNNDGDCGPETPDGPACWVDTAEMRWVPGAGGNGAAAELEVTRRRDGAVVGVERFRLVGGVFRRVGG
jgi:hypothetical protein